MAGFWCKCLQGTSSTFVCISELLGQPEKNVWEKAADALLTRISEGLEPPIPLKF